MFTISIQETKGLHQWILSDGSGTSAAILPAFGATLNAFSITRQDGIHNVIDGYTDAESFIHDVTGQGFKSCKLSPFACRLKNGAYHFGQENYKIQQGFYLNRHALHGLLYNAPFIVLQQEANAEKAMLRLLHQHKGTDAGFPFVYDCVVTYTLEHNHQLTLQTTVTNHSGKLMPIQDGWHPYFTLGGAINDCQLEFQSKELVLFDGELLPTGELKHFEDFGSLTLLGKTEFDHCFTVNFAECQPLCVLRNPQTHIQVEIYPDTSYPYLQVYTPPHRHSIAIENLSAAPDAFNNAMGLKVLPPGETATFTTRYKISVLR